jgi:putative flavoprotein involved in K+ transport
MTEQILAVVIGGGQAGLATSHELTQMNVEHVVLERGRVAQTWRGRWDSFCLVTPNWFCRLPGHHYDGPEPDGFMPRDDIVGYLERYAERYRAPVRENVEVSSLNPTDDGFLLRTQDSEIRARSVVVSTGAYQRSSLPAGAADLPPDLYQVDVDGYRNPNELPDGDVLVIGSGQSGCQIAEECLEAGREVFLSCGRAPWAYRRVADHDVTWWGAETGFLDATLESLPTPAARLAANFQASGRGGGHDLHYRTLRAAGVTLLGHFEGVDGGQVRFADDLGESVAWGDERHVQIMDMIREEARERGMAPPDIPAPEPFDPNCPTSIDISKLGAVVFAGGYRPNYQTWMNTPGAFDKMGFPIHSQGASSAFPGLYFVGVHFLRKRKSSLLYGVGEDATIVATQVATAGQLTST